jgi:hypothetical protein
LNKEYNAPFVPKLKKGKDDVSYFPAEFTKADITSEDFIFDSQGTDRIESNGNEWHDFSFQGSNRDS